MFWLFQYAGVLVRLNTEILSEYLKLCFIVICNSEDNETTHPKLLDGLRLNCSRFATTSKSGLLYVEYIIYRDKDPIAIIQDQIFVGCKKHKSNNK